MNSVVRCLKLLVLVCAVVVLGGCSVKAKTALKGSGYWDTRGLATSTVTGSVIDTKSGSKLFAFSNLENHATVVPKYIEAQLSGPTWNRLAAVVEYNGNYHVLAATHRAGVTYQLPMPAGMTRDRIGLKFEPLADHNRGGQASLSGSILFGTKAYVEGFLDYDLKPHRVNTEWQLGQQLSGPLYAVVEYRFMRGVKQPTGLGIGFEWKVR